MPFRSIAPKSKVFLLVVDMNLRWSKKSKSTSVSEQSFYLAILGGSWVGDKVAPPESNEAVCPNGRGSNDYRRVSKRTPVSGADDDTRSDSCSFLNPAVQAV